MLPCTHRCHHTNKHRRYRALLLGGAAPAGRVGGKSWGGADSSDDDADDADAAADTKQQQKAAGKGSKGAATAAGSGSKGKSSNKQQESLEMTVTFTPGLEKLGAQLLAKKKEEAERKGDSVWDAYLRWACFGVMLVGLVLCIVCRECVVVGFVLIVHDALGVQSR